MGYFMHLSPDGHIDGIADEFLDDGSPNITEGDIALGWQRWPFGDDPPADFLDWKLVDGELVYDPLPVPPVPAEPGQILAVIIEAQQDVLLPLIPDALVDRMESWFPEWDGESHAYEVGNIVSYEYTLYRCIQAHASQQAWNPVDAASLWARVITGDTPQPWVQPSSTNPYMRGDRVTHVGHTWESEIDNNVWEPGVYGWRQVD